MTRKIRSLGVVVAACASVAISAGTANAAPAWEPLAPVETLNVERYVGEWYQLAAIPQPFSLACAKDTKATYGVVDAQNVSVQNTCTTWWGESNEITGNARVVDPVTGAQLHVSFPGVPTQDGLDGPPNYIVSHIAEDYSWALVGDPLRLSGFVLSRTPAVDSDSWREIRDVAQSRGYNTCTILTSPATGGVSDIRPLCSV